MRLRPGAGCFPAGDCRLSFNTPHGDTMEPNMRSSAPASASAQSSPEQSHEQLKRRAALLSLAAAVFLTSVKLVVGWYTNSLALLSEALHSGLDLVAALMTFYAIRVASRPADRRHPYGHGKMENLSALAETMLLFIVCAYVGYEGVHRLIEGGSPVMPSLWGVGVMLLSMAIDIGRVRNLRKVAKETNSQALEADALHFSTDILSSAVVFVGVLAVWLADKLALPPHIAEIVHQTDTVAALVVAIIIFKVSFTMARSALDFLMDAAPEDTEEEIERTVSGIEAVRSLTRLRMRSSGSEYFVDLTVAVDPRLSVADGHRVTSEVEARVLALLPGADVLVHVEPWREGVQDSLLGFLQLTARSMELDLHNIRTLKQGEQTVVMAHVEVAGSCPFGTAYERCKQLEARVMETFPDVFFSTHIEPDTCEQHARELVPGTDAEADFVLSQVQACADREPLVSNVHSFSCHHTMEGLELVFHCSVAASLTVQQMHDISSRMEKFLRTHVATLESALVHMEPAVNNVTCLESQNAAQNRRS